MNTIKQVLIISLSIFFLYACGKKNQEKEVEATNLIEISNNQFTTDSMQLGKIETMPFENIIKCNGLIVPSPNGMAKISTPIKGIIKSIYCSNGQLVDKFQPIIEITGSEIIDLQKDFAEASVNYKRLKNEYDRIRTLYNEKVNSEKEYIFAESEFKSSMAKYIGLKLKIEAFGFSVSKIENGDFYSSFTIKAPIKGYITNLNTSIGSSLETHTELLEIINTDMLHIKLSVFSKDMNTLKKGQIVRFTSANSSNLSYATINAIGVSIDNQTKSIECYAKLANTKTAHHIAYEFIDAEIITHTETVKTLPTSAIVKSETAYFILVLIRRESDKYLVNKIEVKIGRQQDEFTEIIEPVVSGTVITNGVYNIVL